VDADRRPQDRASRPRREIDPIYVDRMIMRWQEFAKDDAVLVATGQTFAQVVKDRARSKKGAA
jgi:hypothetical protein